jgi:hypothetical protein
MGFSLFVGQGLRELERRKFGKPGNHELKRPVQKGIHKQGLHIYL